MISEPLRQLRTAALDLLYPPGCAACDAPDVPFCAPCAETLVELVDPCPRCALPQPCLGCTGGALDGVWSAYAFGGALADALRLLKFSSRTDLGEPLGALLEPGLALFAARTHDAVIVPVPLARGRLRQRGYNQAALLAHAVAAREGRRVRVDLLARMRETLPQVGQSAAERRVSMLGAFTAHACVAGRDVVLVDDVLTTGATLSACALALRLEGARRVVALTVGRALP